MAKPKPVKLQKPPKPRIHVRDHDGVQVRVWTDEMEDYGQFEVVNRSAIDSLSALNAKLLLLKIKVHRCDGMDECDCPLMDNGEPLSTYLD